MQAEPGAHDAQSLPTLTDDDMPALFQHADKRSARAQTLYFTELTTELTLLGLGVLVGAFNGAITQIGSVSMKIAPFDVVGIHITTLTYIMITEAALLLVALLVRFIRVFTKPEKMWYEARAVAESLKSIAWRYAVGGEPFEKAHSGDALSAVLNDRFIGIREDLTRYKAPANLLRQGEVTPQMESIRALRLDQRKQVYRVGRVKNQQDWYTKKAAFNQSRAWWAHRILILVEVLAVFAALLPIGLAALHVFPLNLQSLMANIAGGGVAWMAAKRYEDLNASYSVTAKELEKVASDSERPQDEPAWANFVENAEGAMSREHQLWRATRVEDRPSDQSASAS